MSTKRSEQSKHKPTKKNTQEAVWLLERDCYQRYGHKMKAERQDANPTGMANYRLHMEPNTCMRQLVNVKIQPVLQTEY